MVNADKFMFMAKCDAIARGFGASFDDDREQVFLSKLYESYIADGRPSEQTAWAKRKLQEAFSFADQPPIWVEKEPDWPFINGTPMMFLSQYAIPDNERTAKLSARGYTIYVFSSRQPHPDFPGKFEIIYKVVSQNPSFKAMRV